MTNARTATPARAGFTSRHPTALIYLAGSQNYRHLFSRSSSSTGSGSRRSLTPPPARAVAVPLQEQLASDAEVSLDLVKVQFKVGQYVTSFGQQLKVVGGAPELGEWDVNQVSIAACVGMEAVGHVTAPWRGTCYLTADWTTVQTHLDES